MRWALDAVQGLVRRAPLVASSSAPSSDNVPDEAPMVKTAAQRAADRAQVQALAAKYGLRVRFVGLKD